MAGDSLRYAHVRAERVIGTMPLGLRGDLRVLEGGFAAWEKQGLACASGPCHECTVAGSSKEAGQ